MVVMAPKQIFFKIESIDFQGIARGVAAAEEVDRDKEVLDYEASKPYFQAWSQSVYNDSMGKSYGNVRRQHDDKVVAGRLISPLEFDDVNKKVRITSQILEPVTRELLETGCLTGFSIGGSYVSKTPIGGGVTRYVANPSEVSVVDRPCAPSAVYNFVKSDGSSEVRRFKMSKRQQVVEAVLEALEKAGVPLSEDAAASAGMAQTRQLDAISDKPTQTTADPAAGDKESGKVDLTGADAEGEKRTGGETAGTEAVSEDPNKVKTAVLIPAASNQGAAPAGAAKVAGGGPESVAVGGDPGIVADKDKDKSTKPAGQPIPEAEEEKAAKVEHEALGAVLEKIKAAESSYEGLLAKVDELKKVMTGDATMTEQERLEKMEKARKSVAGHVADIEKALGAHKSAHESLHKAHESLLDAHKAAHEAHKVAHEARLAHKGSHDAMHGKVAESLIGIKKVLGGGPESEFAVGGESFPDNPASIGGTNSGADAADATYAGKAITAADVAKIVKAAVAEALGKGKKVCTVCKEEHDGDGDKCAACKAKKETADKSFTAEDIRKEVANTLKAIFEGMVTPTVAGEVTKAAGVGDRAQAKPFTKSEDNGTGTAASLTSADVMSPEDWKAYSSGNKTAIKKAQHCTVFKWQPVPTRLLSRLSN